VLFPGDHKSLVDLGNPADLVHAHDVSRPVEIAIGWTPAQGEEVRLGNRRAADLSFSAVISINDRGGASIERFSYRGGGATVTMTRKADKEYDLSASGVTLTRRKGRSWPLPPPVRFYGFPDEAGNYFQSADWLPDLSFALQRQFARLHYVGPLREYPARSYLWAGDAPLDVGTRGKDAVPALLAARAAGRKIAGRNFEIVIAHWLKEMGVIEQFKVVQRGPNRKDFEVRVQRTKKSAEVYITDVGFGISQILPVLVQCYYAEPSSTVIFEQPEIHLHPKVAADLADVFIDATLNCDVQFIIESHSEHFLQRLQRRIAEEGVSAETVALYSCDVEGGVSQIRTLDVDEFGTIKNWPKDFFGDPMGEAAARTKAAIARKKKA
jgi:hypothetical protein